MQESNRGEGVTTKKPYVQPAFVVYGSIAKLTQGGNGSGADGGTPGMTMVCL